MELYILQHGDEDICKFGVTNTPDKRVSSLQIGTPHKLRLICTALFLEDDIALLTEGYFHNILRHRHVSGEWFAISPQQAIEVYKQTRNLVNANGGDFPPLIYHCKDFEVVDQVICEECGKIISDARWNQRFCTSSCKQSAYRKRQDTSTT